jgi:hypothetical protein
VLPTPAELNLADMAPRDAVPFSHHAKRANVGLYLRHLLISQLNVTVPQPAVARPVFQLIGHVLCFGGPTEVVGSAVCRTSVSVSNIEAAGVRAVKRSTNQPVHARDLKPANRDKRHPQVTVRPDLRLAYLAFETTDVGAMPRICHMD